ncbi:hypothetical protein [Mycobacterium sp. MS1601]|uniref:hypothetical protein n=1 Tax=Mycobacterium sp. MS1601 TaxID=1936029 RepID=UPI0012F73CC2|nr:hypothetical protein [Mycobacterium sp. MS1601]
MTNKCCVGRVGGLAAALGVGVLLTLCAPTALADDDSPGSASSQDSSQQQDSSTKSDDKQSARAEATKTDAKEERSSTAKDPADEDDDTRPRLSERGSVAESSRDEEPSDDPPADADTEDASEVEASPPDDLPPAEPAVHRDEPDSVTAVLSVPKPLAAPAHGGGGATSALGWVYAATARREVDEAEVVVAADPGVPAASSTSSVPLNADGTRALLTTVEGDSDTGFTTRAEVVDTTTGAVIGTPTILTGAESGTAQVSADGTHVILAAVAYSSAIGSTTSVARINTSSGSQVGATVSVPGDTTGSGIALVSDDGAMVVITTSVYDSRTSAVASWVTLKDLATGEQVGQTVIVPGSWYTASMLTGDRSRLVVTTSVYEAATHKNWTKVAVVDTSTGLPVGRTLTLAGQPSSVTLSGTDDATARITTTTGLAATVNTETGGSSIRPVAFPWGFDISAFLYTPVGQVIVGAVIAAYFVGSAVLVFYVVGPVLAAYDWIAAAVGLPPRY